MNTVNFARALVEMGNACAEEVLKQANAPQGMIVEIMMGDAFQAARAAKRIELVKRYGKRSQPAKTGEKLKKGE